jgi:quinol monooxygenase YgiN
MIHVVAVITAHPGRRAEVLEAFVANTAAVRAEEGCIEYTATIDAAGLPASPGSIGEDTFVVIEKWASLAALQAHAAAPHMKAYAAKVKDLTAKRVIHVLEPVEAG